MVYLVASQDHPAEHSVPLPRLSVIEGGCQPRPPVEREAWRWSPSGCFLLPRTGPYRIRLSKWRVTKAWRALAEELDAVAAANGSEDLDAANTEWRGLAYRAIEEGTLTAWNLRDKIALASVLAGYPFEYGQASDLKSLHTSVQFAFAALDSFAFSQIWAADRPRRRKPRRPC